MSVLVYDAAHIKEALALLTGDNSQPNIQGLLTAFVTQIQAAEDSLNQVILSRYLANASNAQLDLLGGIVGELRNNRTDTQYRVGIRVRILVNLSHGETSEIINIAQTAAPDATISYVDTGDANYSITFTGISSDEVLSTQEALSQSRPLGIGADMLVSNASATASLLLDTYAGGYVTSVLDTYVTSNQGELYALYAI